MEKIKIRCRSCGKELEEISGKTVSCRCPNMATIRNEIISAVDLSNVIMLNSVNTKLKKTILTNEDIAWQEARRQRKVKKLNFEIR